MTEQDRCRALLLDFRLEQWQKQGVHPDSWSAPIGHIKPVLAGGELTEETRRAVIAAVSEDKNNP